MPHPETPPVGQMAETHAQRLIQSCLAAYAICRQTAAYCVDQRGDHAAPRRIQVLYDCADSHLLAADFLGRASRFHRAAIDLAAQTAQACADAFSSFEHDDPQLRKLYAVVAQSAQTLEAFLGGEDEAEEDARDEALKESFPASDPPPPPTSV